MRPPKKSFWQSVDIFWHNEGGAGKTKFDQLEYEKLQNMSGGKNCAHILRERHSACYTSNSLLIWFALAIKFIWLRTHRREMKKGNNSIYNTIRVYNSQSYNAKGTFLLLKSVPLFIKENNSTRNHFLPVWIVLENLQRCQIWASSHNFSICLERQPMRVTTSGHL